MGSGTLARFSDRFGIKETGAPTDDTADKPVPVTVDRPLRAGCR